MSRFWLTAVAPANEITDLWNFRCRLAQVIVTGHGSASMPRQAKRIMRRTQEERRQATQAAVLTAALDVLIADGYANFSASRVAARAGVSRGALERYFPTKNDLLTAATQRAMDAAVAHAQRLASAGEERTVERFLRDSEHFFFGPLYRAMLELAIAAASDKALAKPHRPIVRRARKNLNRIWLDGLCAAGFPRRSAERFILLTHYLLRGLFVVDTWLPYETDRQAVIKAWSALVPALLGPRQTSSVVRRGSKRGDGPTRRPSRRGRVATRAK
jgi:AcrR family transcriptional regulator